MTHYTLLLGSAGGAKAASSFATVSSATATFDIPTGYNAIHIQAAIGGGGGAVSGADYDKGGGESQGPGGGSGAFISDKIFTVAAGETMTYVVGAGGAAGNPGNKFSLSASAGASTTLTGASTGALFTLGGGLRS